MAGCLRQATPEPPPVQPALRSWACVACLPCCLHPPTHPPARPPAHPGRSSSLPTLPPRSRPPKTSTSRPNAGGTWPDKRRPCLSWMRHRWVVCGGWCVGVGGCVGGWVGGGGGGGDPMLPCGKCVGVLAAPPAASPSPLPRRPLRPLARPRPRGRRPPHAGSLDCGERRRLAHRLQIPGQGEAQGEGGRVRGTPE